MCRYRPRPKWRTCRFMVLIWVKFGVTFLIYGTLIPPFNKAYISSGLLLEKLGNDL